MRRRNKILNTVPEQNLDSFLDILTNTVGVLMFISLFVTLITVEADSIVRTPLASETKKNPKFFEIRDNKITYINDAQVGAEIDRVVENLPSCNKPDFSLDSDLASSREYLARMSNYRSCLQSRANRLINFQTQTKYYTVKMVNASTFSLLYEPIETQPGEAEEQFSQPNSDFNQVLAELDPSEDYLAFIVRPNSFSSFRAARELAWAQGFEVGWEPHKTELPIVFGSGGRAIRVQ
ncbi:MAG: hypothetical protein QNJ65_05475 [Xenococcaceae cyanobacterium MO_234.B1]|nr:hypothetical protein [Xenococcaceae cyanobacterium MO_234.B1]